MKIRVEALVKASRRDVWKELADLGGHGSWMKDAVKLEFLSESRGGVDTRMMVRTRIGPLVTEDILEVTGWIEGESISVAHQGVFRGIGEFRLEGDNPTRVIWEETIRFPWWLGGPIAALIARPVLRHTWEGNLQRLAARLADA